MSYEGPAAVLFEHRRFPTKGRVRTFRRRVLAWYAEYGRRLYWRDEHAGEFLRVVVEVFLQRTQAATVDRFIRRFAAEFTCWEDIDSCPQHHLESWLKPLGLWRRRARALKDLARARVEAGQFPEARDRLEQFPAVGQYVANAVELFVYARRRPLIDGNMARIIERYFGPRVLADIRRDSWVQGIAHSIVDDERAIEINWAVLDLGASVCTPRNPKCFACPLRSGCQYRRAAEGSATQQVAEGLRRAPTGPLR